MKKIFLAAFLLVFTSIFAIGCSDEDGDGFLILEAGCYQVPLDDYNVTFAYYKFKDDDIWTVVAPNCEKGVELGISEANECSQNKQTETAIRTSNAKVYYYGNGSAVTFDIDVDLENDTKLDVFFLAPQVNTSRAPHRITDITINGSHRYDNGGCEYKDGFIKFTTRDFDSVWWEYGFFLEKK